MISSPPQRSRPLTRRTRLAGSALELSLLTQKFRVAAGGRRRLRDLEVDAEGLGDYHERKETSESPCEET